VPIGYAIANALFWCAVGVLSTVSVYEVRRMNRQERERPIIPTQPVRRWTRRGPIPPPVAPVTALRTPLTYLGGTADVGDVRKGA